jgi:hypothetical protein
MRDDLSLHLGQARAAETAQRAFRDRENRRQSGVAWSGLSLPALAPRTEAELHAIAGEQQLAAQAWRDRPEGGFLTAIAAIQRNAARLHACAEQARAGAARGLAAERAGCAALLHDLRRQSREISAGLREARRALDRLP